MRILPHLLLAFTTDTRIKAYVLVPTNSIKVQIRSLHIFSFLQVEGADSA